MTEMEQKELAERLIADSDVLNLDRALEIVRRRPAEAERLVRDWEEMKKAQEERARARQRMRQALLEEFG